MFSLNSERLEVTEFFQTWMFLYFFALRLCAFA